jgi:hypothetical protein
MVRVDPHLFPLFSLIAGEIAVLVRIFPLFLVQVGTVALT